MNDEKTTSKRPINLILIVELVAIGALALLIAGPALISAFFDDGDAIAGDPIIESFAIDSENSAVAKLPDGLGGLRVGEAAPDFTLLDTDGNEVSLAAFAGKGIMINFWATWCAPCRIEMPEMQAAYEKYADEGFVILALNQDEAAETVTSYFYDEMGLTFLPLLDTNHVISAEYGAFNIYPSSYFIDPDGNIAAVHRGPATKDQLEAYIKLILPSG